MRYIADNTGTTQDMLITRLGKQKASFSFRGFTITDELNRPFWITLTVLEIIDHKLGLSSERSTLLLLSAKSLSNDGTKDIFLADKVD